MNGSKAYLEHVAIWVKDIHWHIRFFEDVFGMTMREVDGTVEEPRQYWTSAKCRRDATGCACRTASPSN